MCALVVAVELGAVDVSSVTGAHGTGVVLGDKLIPVWELRPQEGTAAAVHAALALDRKGTGDVWTRLPVTLDRALATHTHSTRVGHVPPGLPVSVLLTLVQTAITCPTALLCDWMRAGGQGAGLAVALYRPIGADT